MSPHCLDPRSVCGLDIYDGSLELIIIKTWELWMFVSTWTRRLTTWSYTQCADGAQQRMCSPDVAPGKVSDQQQLCHTADQRNTRTKHLFASIDFRVPTGNPSSLRRICSAEAPRHGESEGYFHCDHTLSQLPAFTSLPSFNLSHSLVPPCLQGATSVRRLSFFICLSSTADTFIVASFLFLPRHCGA